MREIFILIIFFLFLKKKWFLYDKMKVNKNLIWLIYKLYALNVIWLVGNVIEFFRHQTTSIEYL